MDQPERPNILAIMSDQHSRRFLGCHGNRIVRTPNLDRLAAEGLRFDNAYCPSPLCVPSRMSFMTARTPSHNRVWNNEHGLSSGVPTWADALSLAGYETLLFGRMHFNGPDQHHGFQRRPIGSIHSLHAGADLRGGPMWTKFPPGTCGQLRESVTVAGTGRTFYQWFDDQTTRAASDWLCGLRSGGAGRPFAAVVGFMLPHCPFVAPEDLFNYYYDRADVPTVEADQPAAIERFRTKRDILRPLSEHQVRVARAAYYALCEYTDRLVGQLLEALAASGQTERTLVVYTSDHGEAAGEHGCWWKSHYYEGSVGIPLIARWPGVVPAGRPDAAVCNLIDLGPTFAEAAGAPAIPFADGRSLWPIFRGEAGDRPDTTFSELVDMRNGEYASRMIRRGPWKLWSFDLGNGSGPELAMFNLAEDPGELKDRAADPAVADVRADLRRQLYADWDPAGALRESNQAEAQFAFLCECGKKLQRQHECGPTLPPADYETFTQR